MINTGVSGEPGVPLRGPDVQLLAWVSTAPLDERHEGRQAADASRSSPPGNGNVGHSPDNDHMRLWHKHIWGEWERAWGKGSPKDYVLERKCTVCGKTQTQVIR